jgi:hypothetical protein
MAEQFRWYVRIFEISQLVSFLREPQREPGETEFLAGDDKTSPLEFG